MNDKILEVEKLVKTYGSIKAVDGISFSAHRGSITGILGPNGAGKTSTLECAEGLLAPDSGRISTYGRAGIQLQSSALPENMTVSEIMRLFCAYRKLRFTASMLERLGLEKEAGKQYFSLSTGNKRRLALALAIIHNPEILFLDEPSAGLDAESRARLHSIIRELRNQGTAIILATHDMAEAEKLSDRIIILLNGKIRAEGTPREITAQGGSLSRLSVKTEKNSVAEFAETLPFAEGAHVQDGYTILFSEDIGKTASSLISRLNSNGDRIVDLRIEKPSLEERFIQLTGVLS